MVLHWITVSLEDTPAQTTIETRDNLQAYVKHHFGAGPITKEVTKTWQQGPSTQRKDSLEVRVDATEDMVRSFIDMIQTKLEHPDIHLLRMEANVSEEYL
jgi:hypothetical protein